MLFVKRYLVEQTVMEFQSVLGLVVARLQTRSFR